MEDDVVQCSICSVESVEDDFVHHSSEDTLLCNECLQVCNRCDDFGDINDSFYAIDNEMWCESCTENHASWCGSCEEYSAETCYYISDRSDNWCQRCTEDYATWCEWCDEYNRDGCDSCDDSDDVDNDGERLVHDYSYHPDPIFHSTEDNARLFFGMEIEVEAVGNRKDSAQYTYNRLEVENSLAYLKNDSSLNNGFEIVTHPMTYDFFTNQADEFWLTLDELKNKYGLKSWSTRTCGLHIHISRSGFSGGAHMHRFLNLVYSNQEFYEAMAGRSSSNWAKFDDATKYNPDKNSWGKSFAHKLGDPTQTSSERYSAVNTNNRHTLEMRIWRGSINSSNVRGALGLAHASVEYTRTMTLQEVKGDALTMERFTEYIRANEELYSHTIARMSRCLTNNN